MSFKEKIIFAANNNSDKLAVVDYDNNIFYTYKDLIDYFKGFQEYNLVHKKIGIFIDKSADYFASVFSVSLSQCSFIPLDPSLPEDRLRFIISDSQIDYILTNDKNKNNSLLNDYNLLLMKKGLNSFNLEYNDNDLMYTIYTSGTTGIPKGVNILFRGIDNVITQQVNIFELKSSNIYWFLSMNFDASLSDIYCSLLSSSTFYINESIKNDTEKFIKFINHNQINYIDIPPSFIKIIEPERLTSLKSIVIGGEVADPDTVKKYSKHMKVINVYGPTEATICTSYSICDENWSKPLIGLPLMGVNYAIFDENLNNVELNSSGELYISGIQLASGYTNDKITAERFINIDNITWYKTGDRVLNTSYGIEFIGRIDRQIKHNGQLICLEEIEQTINNIPEIKNVTVVYKNKKLYTYYEGDINKEHIIKFISKVLPNYMIPHFYLNLKIPKTNNGKNDSKVLTNSGLFENISSLFKSILELEDIDETLSFSDNGADSLNFILLKKELFNIGIDIPFSYLILNNSIEDIINYKKNNLLTKKNIIENFDFNLIHVDKNLSFNNNKVALITGVTGNLGSELLKNIYLKYDKIYCLIRAKNFEDAMNRYLCNNDLYENIEIIPISNLYDSYLGMSHYMYESLINEVSYVYHNAANINNILTFDKLYNDNVISTVNIINFSSSKKIKKIFYASTLSVHVSGTQQDYVDIDESPLLINDDILYNGYSQTKWLCDYLMTYSNIYNNIKQFRFGLLVPNYLTEKDSKSFLYQLINEINNIENLPEDNLGLCFDLTTTEWAAKIVSEINFDDFNHIYNISTKQKVYYNDLVNLFNKETINKDDWFIKNNNYLSQLLGLLRDSKYNELNLFEMTFTKSFITENIRNFDIPFKSKTNLLNIYKNYFNIKNS